MHRNRSEKVVAATTARLFDVSVLVTISFGFLGYRAMTEQNPPLFVLTVESVEPIGTQRAVTVPVANRVGRPVADLCVHTSGIDGRPKDAVIDYVPAGSSRRVTFLFDGRFLPLNYEFVVDSFTNP